MSRGVLTHLLATLLAIKASLQRLLRRGWRNLLVAGSLSITLMVVATILDNSPFVAYLRYWRGYPWLPAIVFSVGLVSVFALAGSSPALREWANDNSYPWLLRLMLRILSSANPEPFSTQVWRLLVIGMLALLVGLWASPECITSSDILVSFRISKAGTPITILSPRESRSIEPGVTIILEAKIEPVSHDMDLPILECTWRDAGIGSDGHLLHTQGCTVDYLSGQDDIADPVSMQLTQWHCSALEPYPFFLERKQ